MTRKQKHLLTRIPVSYTHLRTGSRLGALADTPKRDKREVPEPECCSQKKLGGFAAIVGCHTINYSLLYQRQDLHQQDVYKRQAINRA